MKNLPSTLLFLLVTCLFLACNSGQESGSAEDHEHVEMHDGHDHMKSTDGKDKSGPEYTSKYICPMHCEGSGSDEPGECPVCGMDYQLNEAG